jgi:hypothetical protein
MAARHATSISFNGRAMLLVAVEGALVLADHDCVDLPLRLGERILRRGRSRRFVGVLPARPPRVRQRQARCANCTAGHYGDTADRGRRESATKTFKM